MSKIGKLPIRLPEGVTLKTGDGWAEVVGPKGSIKTKLHEKTLIKINSGEAVVEMAEGNLLNIHGTTRALLSNMVKGVTEGWTKTVELSGTGYRAGTTGSELQLALGFSHPVVIKAPPGINFR
jgi:large subunit ribosomal protein L6